MGAPLFGSEGVSDQVGRVLGSDRSMIEVAIYTLLAALGLSAAGFLVYWLRGRVLEHRLAILDAVADLSQRIAQLENALHASDRAPLERKIDGLADRLKDVDARLASASARELRPPPAMHAGEPRPARELAADALEKRGFHAIRILGENAIAGGPVDVRVEATREGLAMKGSVFVSGGTVAELRLTPVFELFP